MKFVALLSCYRALQNIVLYFFVFENNGEVDQPALAFAGLSHNLY